MDWAIFSESVEHEFCSVVREFSDSQCQMHRKNKCLKKSTEMHLMCRKYFLKTFLKNVFSILKHLLSVAEYAFLFKHYIFFCVVKNVWHFSLIQCLHLKYISNVSDISRDPYFHRTNDLLLNWTFWHGSRALWMLWIYHRPLWVKNTSPDCTWFTHLTEDYFCMKKFVLA